MEFLVPDLLADVRLLSPVLSAGAVVIGLVLWLAGWWTHRFWVVLTLTVGGGVAGLHYAAELHTQPLVAALAVSLAAGILALTLIRLLAFAAGGFAALVVTQVFVPQWDQALLTFLAGSLIGWFLFRWWMMALSSLTGTALIGYGGLALLDKLGKLDAVAWSEQNLRLLNIVMIAMAVGGFLAQCIVDWLRNGKRGAGKDVGKPKPAKKDGDGGDNKSKAGSWWPAFRRAG